MNNSSGQIGLVVLLLMTTMVTLGVGTVSQSTQDLRISRQEYEASIAFNAAEAGIEAALADIEDSVSFTNGVYNGNTQVGDISVDYQITEQNQLDIELRENETIFVNTRDATNPLSIGFSCPIDGTNAGVIIRTYSPTGNTFVQSYDCKGAEGFNLAPSGVSIDLAPTDVLVSVTTVLSGSRVSATADSLPVQAHRIVSRAKSPETDETKVVQLEKTVDMPVPLFSYALFSGRTISMEN